MRTSCRPPACSLLLQQFALSYHCSAWWLLCGVDQNLTMARFMGRTWMQQLDALKFLSAHGDREISIREKVPERLSIVTLAG